MTTPEDNKTTAISASSDASVQPNIQIQHVGAEQPESLNTIRQLFTDYVYALPVDIAFQDIEAELKQLPGKYAAPHGTLLLATVDGQAAGCIGIRPETGDACEMKRLYVAEEFRRLKLGRLLVEAAIHEAQRLGYAKMRLDTLERMIPARRLYESFGFREIDAYIYNPLDDALFMEVKIDEVLKRLQT
ncbi:GNAT family N-acetyltransferase [Paenibacillus kandeliae]|uniref:GNAT family N-acetyltransferase n=1 Tax=Paenibacillus kandeliae TaxID=3231269 RepID=UPI003458C129